MVTFMLGNSEQEENTQKILKLIQPLASQKSHIKPVSPPKLAINDQQLTFSYAVQSASLSSHSIPWFSPAESAPGDLSRCWTLPRPVNRWGWQGPLLAPAANMPGMNDRPVNYLSFNFFNFLFGLLLNEGHHVLDLPKETNVCSNSGVSQDAAFVADVVSHF